MSSSRAEGVGGKEAQDERGETGRQAGWWGRAHHPQQLPQPFSTLTVNELVCLQTQGKPSSSTVGHRTHWGALLSLHSLPRKSAHTQLPLWSTRLTPTFQPPCWVHTDLVTLMNPTQTQWCFHCSLLGILGVSKAISSLKPSLLPSRLRGLTPQPLSFLSSLFITDAA